MNSGIAAIVVLFLGVSAFYLQKARSKKENEKKANEKETND